MFEDFPDVLTVPQLRQALPLGKNKIYELLESEQIGSFRIGRKILIPKSCLIDFVGSALLDSPKSAGYNDLAAAGESDTVRKEQS